MMVVWFLAWTWCFSKFMQGFVERDAPTVFATALAGSIAFERWATPILHFFR